MQAKKTIRNSSGFIHLIVILIMALIILSLLGVDLNKIFKNGVLRDNLKFVWDSLKNIWNTYMIKPAEFLWNIFIEYIWTPINKVIKK